jgi:hypothetical protein
MSGEVGCQDLGNVTQFCKEDNDERGRYHPATRNRFAFNNGLLLALSCSLSQSESGSYKEHQGDDAVQHMMGRRWKRVTPTVTAITAGTTKAPAAPSQTAKGLPCDDITSEANIVLSGNSPRKMIGKTVTTMAISTVTCLAGAKKAASSRLRL